VKKRLRAAAAFAAFALLSAAATQAVAADNVKIGVLFPLTGNAAAAGQASKAAVEIAAEIINGKHPELANIPLAADEGLPGLGGAKLELIFVDHQGNPSVAQQQALRLVSQDKVNVLFGAYQSSCSLTATAVGERYGIPFMVGDSAALNITGRGFKWVFRVTPIASDYAATYMRFFADMKKQGKTINSIAIVNENTDYGTSVADAVIFISYTSDSILYMKTMRNVNYLPPMVIGDDSGFSDPSFIPAVFDIAQGAMNRSAWDIGKPGSTTSKINDMYKAKTGRDLDDTSARNMQAMLALGEALNRAGSTDPEKIRDALARTDLKPAQLMMGYDGVKFDATGQNILASTYLIQLKDKAYKLVWPDKAAEAKLDWPMKGWK
jgi:branched-chain amino acid transport system substrate-binding protein